MKHAKWILWILILPMPLLLVGSLCWTCWTISQNQPFGETSSFVAEELVIRNCESTSDDSVTFTILNVGRDSSTIVFAYINGETATLEPNVSRDGYNACTIHKDTSANFTVTLQDQTHFNSSETYEFKLITAKGTIISNNATHNPT
jgi:hypothetical protein